MVITETGAAKAVSKGSAAVGSKLTGNAIRVPTPDVSMAILNVKLTKPAGSAEELNELFRRESIDGELRRQVGYSDSPRLFPPTSWVPAPQVLWTRWLPW